MIDAIYDALEALGYEPVEFSETDVSVMVEYAGMVPADQWYPEATEMYEVSVWINEMSTERAKQKLLQTTMRNVYVAVTGLFGKNIENAFMGGGGDVVNEINATDPTFRMIISTPTPKATWEPE